MKAKVGKFEWFEIPPEARIAIAKDDLTMEAPAGVVFDILRALWVGGVASRAEFEEARKNVVIYPDYKKLPEK